VVLPIGRYFDLLEPEVLKSLVLADFIGTIGSCEDEDARWARILRHAKMADHFNQAKIAVPPTDLTLRTAYITAAFCSVIAVIYAVSSAEPTPAVAVFMSFAPIVSVCAWLQKDARVTDVSNVHDLGLFLYFAWPFLIPWYAFKTRGRSGWRLAARLFSLACAPVLAAYVAAIVLIVFSLG
jgi:hypothetical protein